MTFKWKLEFLVVLFKSYLILLRYLSKIYKYKKYVSNFFNCGAMPPQGPQYASAYARLSKEHIWVKMSENSCLYVNSLCFNWDNFYRLLYLIKYILNHHMCI